MNGLPGVQHLAQHLAYSRCSKALSSEWKEAWAEMEAKQGGRDQYSDWR